MVNLLHNPDAMSPLHILLNVVDQDFRHLLVVTNTGMPRFPGEREEQRMNVIVVKI